MNWLRKILTLTILLMTSLAYGLDIPFISGKDSGIDWKNTIFSSLIVFFLYISWRKLTQIEIHVKMNAKVGEIVQIIALKHIENHGPDKVLQKFVKEYETLKMEATKSEGLV